MIKPCKVCKDVNRIYAFGLCRNCYQNARHKKKRELELINPKLLCSVMPAHKPHELEVRFKSDMSNSK